jgi:hypothetical protein
MTSAPASFSEFTKAAEFVKEERRVSKSQPLAYRNKKVRQVDYTQNGKFQGPRIIAHNKSEAVRCRIPP